MRTDELIAALAAGAGPAPRAVAARRLLPAVAAGAGASLLLALLTIGPVPDFSAVGPALALKLVYAGALAVVAGWLTAKLARPVARAGRPTALVMLLLGSMGLAGLAGFFGTPGSERMPYLLGHSWSVCPWAVLALSLPSLAGALWAVRGLAPTRPRAAGAAAGLLAGAVGAFGYAFACTEQSTAFVALWYTAGILMAAGLGALLGPRVLRW